MNIILTTGAGSSVLSFDVSLLWSLVQRTQRGITRETVI